MATLLPTSYVPKTQVNFAAPHKEWQKQMNAEHKEIRAQGFGVVCFPRGDGHATYIVRCLKPLKLQHVESGDAWHADYATIRGLRLADVQARIHKAH